jgi:hypothetical protein
MKWTSIIIVLFGLTACNNRTDKTVVEENAKTVHLDSFYIDSNEVGGPYREFNPCNFNDFIVDKKTPKLAIDIYLDKDWNLSNEKEALALLDSLTAINKLSRPFYFKVVTKTYKKSDGYFSEGLGLAGKEYVENNTKEFAAYFDNKECFDENDLETWAKIVLLEFHIIQPNIETTKEEHLIYGYCRKLISNSKKFPKGQKRTIEMFTRKLEKEWGEFLKNI